MTNTNEVTFSDFHVFLKSMLPMLKKSKKPISVNFLTRTSFQAAALNTLRRHPANSRGIATAVYGRKAPRDVSKARNLLRRLREAGFVKKDRNNVWFLV